MKAWKRAFLQSHLYTFEMEGVLASYECKARKKGKVKPSFERQHVLFASPHLVCDKIFPSRLCTVLSALNSSMKMIAAAAP